MSSAGLIEQGIFDDIAGIVYELCGICLHEGKKELVRARLNKRLRELGLTDLRQYVDYIRGPGRQAELPAMIDAISTNQTSFFREVAHFDHLSEKILPMLSARREKRLRIWSAGCSSGEEPYSIAIAVREAIPTIGCWDAKILATDISTRALACARQGQYDGERIKAVPPMVRPKAFSLIQARPSRVFEVLPAVRQMVHFARLNLMESWPMQGPFDVIFCRNVMIYFDRPTRERLVGRFHDMLASGGTFFVGHSESLTGIRHSLSYVEPTVYRKP